MLGAMIYFASYWEKKKEKKRGRIRDKGNTFEEHNIFF